jgi:tRNA-modifying protein YgfZ
MSTAAPHPFHGIAPLPDWGLIRASGTDARSFLHGQLTQDVLHLAAGQARLAGYCSAKGRLLASFVIWVDANDDLLLACSADLLPATLKRLKMFVLRAKCTLSDASAELPLHGLVGASVPAGAPWTVDGHRVVHLPPVDGLARALMAGPPPEAPALDPEAWRWLEARSAIPRIVAATVEQFVPQMINLELVGGVNFQKGCYPGQEVVARSQYRGTTKRRAQVVSASAPLQPGQEVFAASDPEQPAGLVVLAAAPAGQEAAALVELKLAALGESLHVGPTDGPTLRVEALPYPLPADAG